MTLLQDVSPSTRVLDSGADCFAQQPEDLAQRMQSLVERKRLKLVVLDGAVGIMAQAVNGPCLYLAGNAASENKTRSNTWQLRAFIDALEASEACGLD